MEKRAICDWLSSTCETEELRFPVLSIYEFICLFVCFRKTLSFFFFFFIGVVPVLLFEKACLIYLCVVGYYLNCIT